MNEMRKTLLAEQKKKKECFKSFFNFLVMNVLGVRKKFFFVVFFIVGFLICGVPTILYHNFKYKMVSIPEFSYKDFVFQGMDISLGVLLTAGYILLEVIVYLLFNHLFNPKNVLRNRRDDFESYYEFDESDESDEFEY